MSILGSVTTGNPKPAGQRIVIAGAEKVGKTTLGMGAPGALLVPCEMDSPALSRYRHTKMLTSFDEVEQLTDELIAAAQQGKIPRGSTIVFDSGTAIERFIHTAVLKEDANYVKAYNKDGVLKANAKAVTMESAHGGYGKGYQRANELFERWLRQLDQLAFYGGINIVITCHVFAARVNDPASGEYDTWDILLHSPKNQKTYGKREIITQWADAIGFLHEPMYVMKAGEGERMNRAVSQNQGRVIGLERTPGWVAGNRYGMNGNQAVVPIPIEQGWNHLADAIYKSTNGNVDLYNRNA